MTGGQARERLGAELRRLRMLAGLSGARMAAAVGISQSTISRIERGDAALTLTQAAAWADAAGAGEERRALVLTLTEAAANEVVTHADRLTGGLAFVQDSVHELEATARTLRHFQPCIIPGLLQTAEYARRILAMADPAADLAQALAARMARQAILYDPGRTLEFVLTEQALRYRPGPGDDARTAQLDHLASVATLETVSLGVIPADAEMHAITRCGFILYEDRDGGRPAFAFTETPHASLSASDPADVQAYRDQLAAFRRSAVCGPEAIDIVRSIAREKRALCTTRTGREPGPTAAQAAGCSCTSSSTGQAAGERW
jgi:transcriptional regulator with XRE-family HTH domain